MFNSVNYVFDKVEGFNRPTLYPGESSNTWTIPEHISPDYTKLNSIIESKYSREYLKICAFYNKMFPTLKLSDWSTCTYNASPFTAMEQEHVDTGNGMSSNYLKQIVDQVTSRLGTILFVPKLLSEEQSLEYLVYKDEVERILRMFIRNDDFNRLCLEAFHNASILGYSHVFIDPFTGKLVKANDYEIGIFESQLNRDYIVQMLYRDYAFPAATVLDYIVHYDEETQAEVLSEIKDKVTVDMKMYFNCLTHELYLTINSKTLPALEYPFDRVLMTSFVWDTGFSKVTTTSLFDLLYPCQREINKITAKIQQLIRLYKGAMPIFSSDVDISMKGISNGSGECLYVDSSRPVDSLVTVLNPTPLDTQLSAEVTNYKTVMYELAGLNQMNFNMDNMRSAAAVIALDQTRDAVFQAQLSGLSSFIKRAIRLYVEFFSKYDFVETERKPVDWDIVAALLDQSYVDLQPVHINDPLSRENDQVSAPTNYLQLQQARATLEIVKGKMTYDTVPYFIDKTALCVSVAMLLAKLDALGISIPESVHIFLIHGFIDAVKRGEVSL